MHSSPGGSVSSVSVYWGASTRLPSTGTLAQQTCCSWSQSSLTPGHGCTWWQLFNSGSAFPRSLMLLRGFTGPDLKDRYAGARSWRWLCLSRSSGRITGPPIEEFMLRVKTFDMRNLPGNKTKTFYLSLKMQCSLKSRMWFSRWLYLSSSKSFNNS